jgi:surface antigen
MAGPVNRRASRQPLYNGTSGARLRRECARLSAIAVLLALGLTSSGCALSYRLGSIFGKDQDEPKHEVTGSIAPTLSTAQSPTKLFEGDLVYARAAASEVLTRGGKDASAPWENPNTGARGTVTPIASAHTQDGVTCRDFLASYVRAGTEAWLQGEACRMTAGQWEVKSLKHWKRS